MNPLAPDVRMPPSDGVVARLGHSPAHSGT